MGLLGSQGKKVLFKIFNSDILISLEVTKNMMAHNLLINSSPITLKWLEKLERFIKKEINVDLNIINRKYWAPLRKQGERKNFAYIHPQKTQIRIVLALPKSASKYLNDSPSTKKWHDNFPALFVIKNENDIRTAIRIIKAIYLLTYGDINEKQYRILIQEIIIKLTLI
jgi:hypothetical protein